MARPMRKRGVPMKKPIRITLSVLCGAVLSFLIYYVTLPPIHAQSPEFWTFLTTVIICCGVPYCLLGKGKNTSDATKGKATSPKLWSRAAKIVALLAIAPMLIVLVGNIISSTFFNAKAYASVIKVQETSFAEDMPEADTVTNISLMDTQSAIILGNRELGALSDVVSQYVLSEDYNQINFNQSPKKVANLEYEDFFKWINNADRGIPGYVMVDPVNSEAKYVKFDKPLKYVHSGYFGDDLMRKLRFSYPTKIFGTTNFEVDDEGNPWFIVSCMTPRVGLFGAKDVSEVIVFNPCDGSSSIYGIQDTPAWIDNVYDGYLACEKYDWHGIYGGGFFNSIIGQKDCKQTTDDFGYIVREDDVWYFTGVTSVTADASNIGFILTNARTGEYKYYPVVGAEEYSAMGAAQGEVQEKGYVASFPSLINVAGEATYIMVLKDASGLVKLHALVNVENFSVVATGETQAQAKEAYLELLIRNGLIEDSKLPVVETKRHTFTVARVDFLPINGNTVAYITADSGEVYKCDFASNEKLILLREGDGFTVEYEDEGSVLRQIISWEHTPAVNDDVE